MAVNITNINSSSVRKYGLDIYVRALISVSLSNARAGKGPAQTRRGNINLYKFHLFPELFSRLRVHTSSAALWVIGDSLRSPKVPGIHAVQVPSRGASGHGQVLSVRAKSSWIIYARSPKVEVTDIS